MKIASLRSPGYGRLHFLRYLVLLGVTVFSLSAQAGIGSVWSVGVSDTSIDVAWTPPSGNYQLSGSTPHYKICYKKKGTLPFICSANSPLWSNVAAKTIQGLDADTSYKIRVKCHCERKRIFGGWGWDRWRNISTMEVSTKASSPDPTYTPSSLNITGTGLFALEVTLEHNDMDKFESVRICHKRKYSAILGFQNKCANSPFGSWLYSDHNVGWMDIAPAQPLVATVHSTADLKSCTKYDVVGFGFYPGGGYDKIGDAEARTRGNCGLMNIFKVVVNDHVTDVLAGYAERLDRIYSGGLYPHLVRNYDEHLSLARESIREDYQEDIADTLTLLKVLVKSDSSLLDTWQKEEYLTSKGLTIEGFVASEFPKLYRELSDELQVRGEDWGNPL